MDRLKRLIQRADDLKRANQKSINCLFIEREEDGWCVRGTYVNRSTVHAEGEINLWAKTLESAQKLARELGRQYPPVKGEMVLIIDDLEE